MKKASKYLSQYSTSPLIVDRLIISAFLKINKLEPVENTLLKSYLIYENHGEEYLALKEFSNYILEEVSFFWFEELIELFEFVISPADRIVNGAIYTPQKIREFIVKEALVNNSVLSDLVKISDIACGCGGFLFNAAVLIKEKTGKPYLEILKNNIFGIDIQNYSIERTKLLLSLLALSSGEDEIEYHFNLFQGDSLDFDWSLNINEFKGFDIILGNPPYVCTRNLDDSTKEKIKKWEVSGSGNPDLYIPFFQIAIENLAVNGTLGFITMNSFFKSLNGRDLRLYFESKNLVFNIVDFGAEQIFKSKNTYTCICIIKNENGKLAYHKCLPSELKNIKDFNEFDYAEFDWKKGWLLVNDNTVLTNIQHIQRTGVPLESLVDIKNGFATLRNDVFVLTPIEEDESYYYVEKNGKYYSVEKAICRKAIKPNAISDEINIEKYIYPLIFPYQKKGSLIKIIDEKKLKNLYPKAYAYLSDFKEVLIKRDKGNRQYAAWYAYGRTQALRLEGYKLFFPYMASHPIFILSEDEQLLFYNGYALVSKDLKLLRLLKKILSSSVFWYYVQHHSKPYGSDYMALSKNYIRDFGILKLTRLQTNKLLTMEAPEEIDRYLEKLYKIKI